MEPRGERTDEQLLRELARDPTAFTAFYRRHVREVLGHLARRSGDAELAAEVFAAVLLHAGRFRPERGSARTWLFAIARHKLADARRRGRAEERARRRLGVRDVAVEPDDLRAIEACAQDVEANLAALPAAQREAVRGRVLEELGYAQLAERLGVSQGVVRQRVARGLAALRTTTTEEEL